MCKIVIIEDDIDICNMIKKFLENNKYSVQYALNGIEGINLCKSFVPDLIILDIMLPGLNGDDVLQKLRKIYKRSCYCCISKNNGSDQNRIIKNRGR